MAGIIEDPVTVATVIETLQIISQVTDLLRRKLEIEDSISSSTTAPSTPSAAQILTPFTSDLNSINNIENITSAQSPPPKQPTSSSPKYNKILKLANGTRFRISTTGPSTTNTDVDMAMNVNEALAQSATSTSTPISQTSPIGTSAIEATTTDTITYTHSQLPTDIITKVSTVPFQEYETLPPDFATSDSLPITPAADGSFSDISPLIRSSMCSLEQNETVPEFSTTATTMSLPSFQSTFRNSPSVQQDITVTSVTAAQPYIDELADIHELIQTSNKISLQDRFIIISFMAGSRLNPFSGLGDVISVKLKETKLNELPKNLKIIEYTYILLNYRSGRYTKKKSYKVE